MNWQQPDKFLTVNYNSTNQLNINAPNLNPGVVTPASYNSFSAGYFHPSHPETFPKDKYFEKLHYQRKKDQDFINGFFTEKKKEKSVVHNAFPLKISKAKSIFLEIISLKKQLEKMVNSIDVSDTNFEVKLNLMKELKKDICNRLLKFDPIALKSLQSQLTLRSKKRMSNRKRKQKLKELKTKKLEELSRKHEIINKILNKKAEEVNNIKREEHLKRQADSVLHEVRRKNSEAKKILNTLTALSKLRELRSQQELVRGGYVSTSVTDTFNSVINYFQEKWQKQLELYQLEEKGLKVMLEENTLPDIKRPKYETIFYQWEQALFGENDNLLRADEDMEYFLKIRNKWDKYLVNSPTLISSNIPVGWVVPVKTESKEWQKFLKKKKKSNKL